MPVQVPLLSRLKHYYDDNGKTYFAIDELWDLFKAKKKPQDKDIRKDNFQRDFKSTALEIDSVICTDVSSVVQYAYNHRAKQSCCVNICTQIETRLGVTKSIKNVLTLYHKIAGFDFNRVKNAQTYLACNTDIDLYQSPTLVKEHKDVFTDQEWQRICLFEWHFSQRESVLQMEYDQ